MRKILLVLLLVFAYFSCSVCSASPPTTIVVPTTQWQQLKTKLQEQAVELEMLENELSVLMNPSKELMQHLNEAKQQLAICQQELSAAKKELSVAEYSIQNLSNSLTILKAEIDEERKLNRRTQERLRLQRNGYIVLFSLLLLVGK